MRTRCAPRTARLAAGPSPRAVPGRRGPEAPRAGAAPFEARLVQAIALGVAGAALAGAPLLRPRGAAAAPLPPPPSAACVDGAARPAPSLPFASISADGGGADAAARRGGVARALWGAATAPARAVDALFFPDAAVFARDTARAPAPAADPKPAPAKGRTGAAAAAAAAPAPAPAEAHAHAPAPIAAAAAEPAPRGTGLVKGASAAAAAAADAASRATDAAGARVRALVAAASAVSVPRPSDLTGWLHERAAASAAAEAEAEAEAANEPGGAPGGWLGAHPAAAVAGATLGVGAAALAGLAAAAAAARIAGGGGAGGSSAAAVASWPLPIACFSPWPDNFAVLPSSLAPRHYEDTAARGTDGEAEGPPLGSEEAVRVRLEALEAAVRAASEAGGARPPPAALAAAAAAPAAALGAALGAAAARAATEGRAATRVAAAWGRAIAALGAPAAAHMLPSMASRALAAGAAPPAAAGRAWELTLLCLADAIGAAADAGAAAAAAPQIADPRRHRLSLAEASELLCCLTHALGSAQPLAFVSALSGHLKALGASPDAAAAADAARAAVVCAVHAPATEWAAAAPGARPPLPAPTPEAEALAPAVAELLTHINGRVPTPEAHAATACAAAGLAAAGPGALAAALAALPGAAARVGRRGWPCWGPVLAVICAFGCGADIGEGLASARIPYYGRPTALPDVRPTRSPAALVAASTALARALLPAVLAAGPASAAPRARARGAALAAAALLSWLHELDGGAAGAGDAGPDPPLAARRELSEAAGALAAAAGAPAAVVDALEQQWQLGARGLAGAKAIEGGELLARLDHAAFLDGAPASAPPPRAPAASDGGYTGPRAPVCPAPPVPGAQPPRGAPAALRRRPAGFSAPDVIAEPLSEAEAARAASEALDDLLSEVTGAAERLCRRLALDAALLGRWPAGAAAAGAGGRRGQAGGAPGAAPQAGRGPFADAADVALHLRALASTAPSPGAARARLLPLRQALLHLERLAARLPCPAAGWFGPDAGAKKAGKGASAKGGDDGAGMIWTLHEALWDPSDAPRAASAAAPPPPARLLALALGLLPSDRAASAAAQARALAASEASGLAAAVEAGAAEAFPRELLVGR
ncbi:hypothetical protein Rsub_11828 [Raphidocelis subcapitata]|uniref:Uncharacterized protein n=1 Tax=Raphidocelis subcapitata TaxID=307507 RepID=A0A2V0PGU3_9CHLO|nr:hypothetical protein Rsub_11828 [Raphidocelis subcapitata]|eukprot:GBF99024.1 hypothetical protein Rsub_11828 [Raphidocelis subcapitata]